MRHLTRSMLAGRLAPVVLAAGLVTSAPLSAQLPSASAAALAVGDNYTAVARGFAAVAWNPAGLGMPDTRRFSLTILPGRAVGETSPVTLRDLARYDDTELPTEVREQWMTQVEEDGGQRGSADAGITYLAFNLGRIGGQLSTAVHGASSLSPGGVELLLYGNAGRTGDPRTLEFAGSYFDAAVTSTGALSYGHPLSVGPGHHLAIGATVKYTVGHLYLSGQDRGSVVTADPVRLTIDFPVIQSDTAMEGFADRGSGIGLDLGLAWQGGPVRLGLAVQNLFNTFEWDAESFFYRPISAVFASDTTSSEVDPIPLADAPEDVRRRVEELRFEPMVALGGAVRLSRRVTASLDVRHRLQEEGMRLGAQTHVGAGLEVRIVPFLPVRVGASSISGGHLIGGGVGIELGLVNIAASMASRRDEFGTQPAFAAGVSFGAR